MKSWKIAARTWQRKCQPNLFASADGGGRAPRGPGRPSLRMWREGLVTAYRHEPGELVQVAEDGPVYLAASGEGARRAFAEGFFGYFEKSGRPVPLHAVDTVIRIGSGTVKMSAFIATLLDNRRIPDVTVLPSDLDVEIEPSPEGDQFLDDPTPGAIANRDALRARYEALWKAACAGMLRREDDNGNLIVANNYVKVRITALADDISGKKRMPPHLRDRYISDLDEEVRLLGKDTGLGD